MALLTATEIIKKSWRDYVDNFHDWAIFALFIFLPVFILMVAGSLGVFLDYYFPSSSLTTNIIILLMFIVGGVLSFWNSLALIHASAAYIENKQTDHWKQHYGAALTVFWPAFVVSVIVILVIGLGTMLFVIPGIIFSIWFYFSIYDVVIQNERGIDAMKSSHNLVRGRWWETWWRLAVPTFVFGLCFGLIYSILDGLATALPVSNLSYLIITRIFKVIVSSLTAPLITLISMHVYFSLRENPLIEKPGEMPTP